MRNDFNLVFGFSLFITGFNGLHKNVPMVWRVKYDFSIFLEEIKNLLLLTQGNF